MSDNTIGSIVRKYVSENGRGCPSYVLLAAGFKAKDIKDAVQFGIIESGRGKEGGLFPAGEKPAAQSSDPTLKGQAMALLRIIAEGGYVERADAMHLVKLYEDECARRSESKRSA